MANPELKMEEQLVDARSDQIAYKLTITNPSSEPMRLLSVKPRIPVGASILEVTDSSLAQANAQKAKLLDELNRLLRHYLWVTSVSFRQELISRQKEAFKQIFSAAGIASVYFSRIAESKLIANIDRDTNSYSFDISSSEDAHSAYQKWIAGADTEHETIRTLFEEKTKQLERTEERMDEGGKPGLTSISPGGFFTSTYVMKFPRTILEPRKYQVGFESAYVSEATPSRSSSVATTVQISPHPFSLSIVAVLSALLGTLVRLSINGEGNLFYEMLNLTVTGQILVGPIVALIFFNVYEYTTIGEEIKMSVSWRSALLIGALSGLAHDRILAALKAFIGA